MKPETIRRRSRWMMRAQEWDEPRAPYPNLWHEGMPRRILAFETVASRLRLGDLVAVYYPQSQKHPERSECALGLSRVAALSRADDPRFGWVDLETAHRLAKPLRLDRAPRRVFLCCDPGWPETDVELFDRVLEAAVAEGFVPLPEETEEGVPARGRPGPATAGVDPPAPGSDDTDTTTAAAAPQPSGEARTAGSEPRAAVPAPGRDGAAAPSPAAHDRLFAGAVLGADLRDRRDGSWLAVVRLRGQRLQLLRLEAMDRATLHGRLRDPDAQLMRAEAIGLAFPFGVPTGFSRRLFGGELPGEGWWALAHKIERTTLPDFLVAVQECRQDDGELRRSTDEVRDAPSPLRRSSPDMASMAYHGIKMIGEERSRYAIRPFETAKARLLLEVSPAAVAAQLADQENGRPDQLLDAVAGAEQLPVDFDAASRRRCHGRRQALDAVLAARAAAVAVLNGETDRSAAELHADDPDRVLREGWIYGLDPLPRSVARPAAAAPVVEAEGTPEGQV